MSTTTLPAPSTATRALAINPAFLQEIKEDNRHLSGLRIAVRALIQSRFVLRNHLSRLVRLVDELRDQLAMHFAIEEAYGYFEDAIEQEPRLSDAAARLKDEHCMLFASFVEISDELSQAMAEGVFQHHIDRIADRLHAFDCALSEHEAEETRLIYDALNTDIGGEG